MNEIPIIQCSTVIFHVKKLCAEQSGYLQVSGDYAQILGMWYVDCWVLQFDEIFQILYPLFTNTTI